MKHNTQFQYKPYLYVLGVILKPMSPSSMVDFRTKHPFCVLSHTHTHTHTYIYIYIYIYIYGYPDMVPRKCIISATCAVTNISMHASLPPIYFISSSTVFFLALCYPITALDVSFASVSSAIDKVETLCVGGIFHVRLMGLWLST